jgi:hypothetical protein
VAGRILLSDDPGGGAVMLRVITFWGVWSLHFSMTPMYIHIHIHLVICILSYDLYKIWPTLDLLEHNDCISQGVSVTKMFSDCISPYNKFLFVCSEFLQSYCSCKYHF